MKYLRLKGISWAEGDRTSLRIQGSNAVVTLELEPNDVQYLAGFLHAFLARRQAELSAAAAALKGQ